MPKPSALSLSSVGWCDWGPRLERRADLSWDDHRKGDEPLDRRHTQARHREGTSVLPKSVHHSDTVNCNTVNDLSNTVNNLLETEFPGKKSVCKPVACVSVSFAKAPLCSPFLNESCTQWQVLPNFHKIWFFIFFYSFSSCLIRTPQTLAAPMMLSSVSIC